MSLLELPASQGQSGRFVCVCVCTCVAVGEC